MLPADDILGRLDRIAEALEQIVRALEECRGEAAPAAVPDRDWRPSRPWYSTTWPLDSTTTWTVSTGDYIVSLGDYYVTWTG